MEMAHKNLNFLDICFFSRVYAIVHNHQGGKQRMINKQETIKENYKLI